MFLGYPIWWALGITWLAAFVLTTVMVVELARRRHVRVPKHFGWWLLFLTWVVASALVVQVDAPGAVAGDGGASRYLVWGYRFLLFVEGTVLLVYLCTLTRRVSIERIFRVMSWMFVYIVAGGLLGILVPHFQFTSPAEFLLPGRLTSNEFINSFVHPIAAEVQHYLGREWPRPSAPFQYANSWGLNYICFLPFFIYTWSRTKRPALRLLMPLVLIASAAPVVISLNRAMWATLAVLALFVTLRAAMRGNIRLLVAVVLGVACCGMAVAASPLSSTIQARFSSEQHNSNDGRASLSTLTISSVADGSPVVGFGTTRDVQGSFLSIAVGSSGICPGCSPPSLGTQGQLWLVSFATGFGGLILYLGFLALQVLRHIRNRAPTATAALCVLFGYILTLPFYDLGYTALAALMVSLATLERGKELGQRGEDIQRAAKSLGWYSGLIRRQRVVLVCFCATGLALGIAWSHAQRSSYEAHTSILLPEDSKYVLDYSRPTSLDSLAKMVSIPSQEVGTGHPHRRTREPLGQIEVTAIPNTRVLNLSYTDSTPTRAAQIVTDSAKSLLDRRAQLQRDRQSATLSSLDAQALAVSSALQTLDHGRDALSQPAAADEKGDTLALKGKRQELLIRASELNQRRSDVEHDPLDPGQIIRPTSVQVDTDGRRVSLASGLALGLLGGCLVGWLRDARGKRLLHRGGINSLPVVGRISIDRSAAREAAPVLKSLMVDACLSATTDTVSSEAANRLSDLLESEHAAGEARPSRPRVVLVARSRQHWHEVDRAGARLAAAGVSVTGVLIVTGR